MNFIYPDLDWYTRMSEQQDKQPRCPYVNVHRCPRYYSSLYLLGEHGISTQMEPNKVRELDEFWGKSDLLPVVSEHDTGITTSGNEKSGFSNFCPEVSFDVFGLFAVALHRYADAIDQDAAHSQLEKRAYPKDWRWQWAVVEPLHYLDCPVYSQLLARPATISLEHPSEKSTRDLLEVKPGFLGVSLNIKELLSRFAKWWLAKYKD